MKQKLLLAMLTVLVLPVIARARDFTYTYEDQTLKYTVISEEDKTCMTKKGYKTSIYTYTPGNNVSGNIVIPSIASDGSNEYTVTEIGDYAFYDCEYLTSVTIPNSVTSIGEHAFSYCSGLTSVTIPNSVTSIGEFAFSSCSGLASVTIPNSVTRIGEYAFSFCSGLTSVTIPNSVTSIEKSTFSGCSGLTSVTIPNSVTSIGEHAFSSCSGLTSVTIPNSVTSIGYWAFSSCSGLTSVTIPNSVTSLGTRIFYYCEGLASVTLPSSLSSIGDEVFYGCHLKELLVPKTIRCSGMSQFIKPSQDIGVNTLSMDFYCASYLKIIDEEGNEVPIKEAAEINSSYDYEWNQGTVTFKNLHPSQNLSFSVLGIDYYVETDNIDISLKIEEYADLAVVEASFDYEELVTDYYWNYKNGNKIQKKRLSIPYGTVAPKSFHIIGDGFTNDRELKINYPKPAFTECEAVATSLNKARLTAKCNLSMGASATIEWRRNNAPDNVKSNTVTCPVVNGVLMGELRGLKDDVYYKFRPVYERDGVKYHGEWVGIFTGDAGVYFAPEVGTLASVVADNKAELEGYVYPGTDDVSESGIEYRVTDTSVNTDGPQRAAGEWIRVLASSSTFFKVLLENLTYDSEYEYRTFAVAGDNTYYGETAKFRTESSSAGIDEILADNDGRLKVFLHSVPKGGNPKVIANGNGEAVDCHIHTITGLRIKSCQVVADGTPQEVEANLTPGIYVLTVAGTRGTDSIRMIVR